jgi:opacity protein-like surface antigen
MSIAKILAFAGASAAISTTAIAADLTLPVRPQPVMASVDTGWYLKGYLGMSNQFFNGLSHPDFLTAPTFGWYDKGGFDSGPIGGFGVGYTVNNWLRFDVTGEYRGKVGFHALDTFTNVNTGGINSNDYTASKSEWVGLVNAYIDLGTWMNITPYVGAGVGFANIKIDHFRDTNVIAAGGGWAPSGSQTNFAWALHAGASYRVTSNFAVDLSYRYLNMGDGRTGTLTNLDPNVPPVNVAPMRFNNIQSHDLMLGVRWMLQSEQPVAPIIRKG